MEHPCYKCGHSVEDGKPFCQQCRAPQIRVAVPEPVASSVSGNVSPVDDLPIFSDSSSVQSALKVPPISVIDWSAALRSCAIAAFVAALVMALGLMVPLLAALGAGFLGVILYHRKSPAWNVNARSGALLGAVCGVLFFGLSAVFETVAAVLFHTGGQIRQKMAEALQQAASRSNDPQVQAAFERLKTPEGFALMLAFGLVFLLLVSIAACSLAGALTGSLMGRRNRR